MTEIRAVLTRRIVEPFHHWPVIEPSHDPVVLSKRMSPLEVGTAMAIIAEYNKGDDRDDVGLLRNLAEEHLVAPGGLLTRDTATGVEVEPGCCCGLEDWREWYGIVDGTPPWLGHNPEHVVRIEDGVARFWSGTGDVDAPPVEISIDELSDLLAAVQQDLRDFLGLVGEWATPYGTALAVDLVASLDRQLRINAPQGP